MQPHELHQHLVGVGRAVKGAGPRPVIGRHLCRHQFFTPHFPGSELLAHLGLFVVADAAGHRTSGQKHDGQMPECLRRDHQPRHDLVAHSKENRRVENVMRQRNPRRHRDGITGKQAQLHSGLALRDPVAHGRHTARHLRRPADRARRFTQQLRKTLERLMRRQHVIIGRHDPKVARSSGGQLCLVLARRRISMRLSATGKMRPRRALLSGGPHPFKIGLPGRRAAFDNPLGHASDSRIQGHDSFLTFGSGCTAMIVLFSGITMLAITNLNPLRKSTRPPRISRIDQAGRSLDGIIGKN